MSLDLVDLKRLKLTEVRKLLEGTHVVSITHRG